MKFTDKAIGGMIIFGLVVFVIVSLLVLTCQDTETVKLEEAQPTGQMKGLTDEYEGD